MADSLQDHIDSLNEAEEKRGGCFFLADADHFRELYGIYTVQQFEDYMAIETYRDLYKEVNGIKPRWHVTAQDAREWLERLAEEAQASREEEERVKKAMAEAEAKKQAQVEENPNRETLTIVDDTPQNNPFAEAFGK